MSEENREAFPAKFTLEIRCLPGSTLILAESPQIRGLHMAARSYAELFRKTPMVIEELHKAREAKP